ncbi:MAG: hypothetical protein K0R38_2584 [Polyangiaceae bacterium]|jgi:hypothetical protein|nr:hypothetical protein [Polyangiaceae bacterium]
MARVVTAALLLCLGLGLACGCSGKTEDEETEIDPVAACYTYATTWCNRAFNCYAQVGRISQSDVDANASACVDVIVTRFPCSAASSLGDDYDKCISQVKGMACSRWNVPQLQFATVRPPVSCDTALNFE